MSKMIEELVTDILEKEEFFKKDNTEMETKAASATKEYCLKRYEGFSQELGQDIEKDDIKEWAWCFYDGYMAAKTGKVKLA
jgi:hypothetical protein